MQWGWALLSVLSFLFIADMLFLLHLTYSLAIFSARGYPLSISRFAISIEPKTCRSTDFSFLFLLFSFSHNRCLAEKPQWSNGALSFRQAAQGPRVFWRRFFFWVDSLWASQAASQGSQGSQEAELFASCSFFLFFDRLGGETQILPEGSDGGQVIWDSIHWCEVSYRDWLHLFLEGSIFYAVMGRLNRIFVQIYSQVWCTYISFKVSTETSSCLFPSEAFSRDQTFWKESE